jgi:uncharacterized protein
MGLMTWEDQFEHEHRRYSAYCEDRSRLLIAIAPTMSCNLNCSYCFQKELPACSAMTDETADALVDLIARRAAAGELREVLVQWFGGEPLLEWGLIRRVTGRLTALSRNFGFSYSAEILTNGLLLWKRGLWRELEHAAVSMLQISLDGLPETYARRKGVHPEVAHGFYRFLAGHLNDILRTVSSIVLRINIDQDNAHEARKVIDLLASSGVDLARIDIRLGFLTEDNLVGCLPHRCLEPQMRQDVAADFAAHLESFGALRRRKALGLGRPCGAHLRTHLSVDPQGRITRCVPLIGSGQAVVTTLAPKQTERTEVELGAAEHPFGTIDPFTVSPCGQCPLLPLCLGSCLRSRPATESSRDCPVRDELERKILISSLP